MAKEIRLNAFAMNCVVHQSPGLWTHPSDRSIEYNRLPYWIDLAKILERGKFDGLFLADVLGVYDVFGGNAEYALRHASQVPVNDPLMLISAMALMTRHLGFGVTCNLSYEPPYLFARRMSTLDHLTEGRIGWNVVTGYLDSAARAMGLEKQTGHDQRYDIAEDYMQVVYKLWEGSWEDDAVLRDRSSGVYAQPDKVHNIRHVGPNYRVNAIHLSEPSPQRTPVLYQAGTSSTGRGFAARHAECIFVGGLNPTRVGESIRATRGLASQAGRNPDDILFFLYAKVITADTEAEVRRKYEEYLSSVSFEGAMALLCGWSGIDFSKFDPDKPLRYIETNAARTVMQAFIRDESERQWTLRELIKLVGVNGGGTLLMGTPEQLADTFQN